MYMISTYTKSMLWHELVEVPNMTATKIYLVWALYSENHSNPDEVVSVWTQKDNAQKECDMLNEEHGYNGLVFTVEEHEVSDL
jgi:hypothetical protein